MAEVITHKTPQDFIEYNRDFIYDNYFIHYHLISAFKKINNQEINLFDAYNVIDNDGSNVLCFWCEGCYYLYSFKWTDDIIIVLHSKIDVPKATHRFTFMGQRDLIIQLFEKFNLSFKIFKDRLVYECSQVAKIPKNKNGQIENASDDDFDELVNMSRDNYLEEYKGKGQKTFEEMQRAIANGIETNRLYIVRDKKNICCLLQIINSRIETPMIGNLFTKKEKRHKGFATLLLHVVTENLLNNGAKSCGLLSDITNSHN